MIFKGLSIGKTYRGLNHVLCIGQSLAVGAGGFPPITTKHAGPRFKMFNGGVYGYAISENPLLLDARHDKFAKLVNHRESLSPYVADVGETIFGGFRGYLQHKLPDSSPDYLFSQHGIGSAIYSLLKKGGTSGCTYAWTGSNIRVTSPEAWPGAGAAGPVEGMRIVIFNADDNNLNREWTIANVTLLTFDLVGSTPAAGTNCSWKGIMYDRSIYAVQRGLLACRNRPYQVPAILCLHGEGDHINNIYGTNIATWQSDYESDIKTITGQSGIIPMFHSQVSSWTQLGGATHTLAPFLVLSKWKNDPTKTVLVGPRYMLPYYDGLHLTSEGYIRLGEYYGRAYYQQVVLGQPYEPLYPELVEEYFLQPGDVTTFPSNWIRFLVSFNRDVVIDDVLVKDPGHFGFEYFDDQGVRQIIGIERGQDYTGDQSFKNKALVVVLDGESLVTGVKIRYGYTGIPFQDAGPMTGPRGCVRDDSTEIGPVSGQPMYNWCVHFDEPAI